ncbi:MAG: efflux RND transporter periplasmic adaptor subunit [Pseudomonadota bacterium]
MQAATTALEVARKDLPLAIQTAEANQTRSAEEAVRVAERQLAQARLGDERLRAMADEVKALAAQLDQARAGLAEAESVRADLTIAAPASGIVTQRLVNADEVVAAGSPLFDIVDLDRLYLQVYVPACLKFCV